MKPTTASFWHGVTFAVACLCLLQELLGQARYLALVEHHWIDIHWIVWVAVVVLALRAQRITSARIFPIRRPRPLP